MGKPEDIPQDVWDAANQLIDRVSDNVESFDGWDRPTTVLVAARAILAAKAEEREACATHLDKRGEDLYVDYDDKVSMHLCEDLAHELRKRGEPTQ